MGKQQCPFQFTAHAPSLSKLFKDAFQKTRSKPSKRYGFCKTVVQTPELREGKIQVAVCTTLQSKYLSRLQANREL